MRIEWPLVCGILSAWAAPSSGGQVPGFENNPPPPPHIVPPSLWEECKVPLAYTLDEALSAAQLYTQMSLSPEKWKMAREYVDCLERLVKSILDNFHLLDRETFDYFFNPKDGLLARTGIDRHGNSFSAYRYPVQDRLEVLPLYASFKASSSIRAIGSFKEINELSNYEQKKRAAQYCHSTLKLEAISTAIGDISTEFRIYTGEALYRLSSTLESLYRGYHETLPEYFEGLRRLITLTEGTSFWDKLVRGNLDFLSTPSKIFDDLKHRKRGTYFTIAPTPPRSLFDFLVNSGQTEITKTLQMWSEKIHKLFWTEATQLLHDHAILSINSLHLQSPNECPTSCDSPDTWLATTREEMGKLEVDQRTFVGSASRGLTQNSEDKLISEHLGCFTKLIPTIRPACHLLHVLLQTQFPQCLSPALAKGMLDLHQGCWETAEHVATIFDILRTRHPGDIVLANAYYDQLFPVLGSLLAVDQLLNAYRGAYKTLTSSPARQDRAADHDWVQVGELLATKPTISVPIDRLPEYKQAPGPPKRAQQQ